MSVAPTTVQPRREHSRSPWVLGALLALLLGGLAVLLLYRFDVLGASSSGSAIEGSGIRATQTRDVAAFHGIDLAGGNNVVVHVGGKRSVIVKADDNLLSHVTTEVRSGTLVIGNTSGSIQAKSPMSVDVTVPTLDALVLAGGGTIVVNGIDAESLTVALSGSGNVTGSGTATSLRIRLDGSGNVWFARVAANDVEAVLSGSGNIVVTASESLDASVPGSGTISYTGNPQEVTKSITGSGAITAS